MIHNYPKESIYLEKVARVCVFNVAIESDDPEISNFRGSESLIKPLGQEFKICMILRICSTYGLIIGIYLMALSLILRIQGRCVILPVFFF